MEKRKKKALTKALKAKATEAVVEARAQQHLEAVVYGESRRAAREVARQLFVETLAGDNNMGVNAVAVAEDCFTAAKAFAEADAAFIRGE